MKTNYILIDYENVQPTAVTALNQEHIKVAVFVGASQSKISFELAHALQPLGARAEYIKISGNGTNALDFHLAFYLGQLVFNEPDACFHIISKDTGFDPLVQHLKSRSIHACRWRDLAETPFARATQTAAVDERLAVIISRLHQPKATRPRTVKTLSNVINTIFHNLYSEQERLVLVQKLEQHGIITISNTKVSYTLPA